MVTALGYGSMVEFKGPTENNATSGEGFPDQGEIFSSAERLTPEAVQTLYEGHASEITAFLQGVLRDPEATREALQTTFQRVLEAGHTARPEAIRAWLFRVAFHEAMALRRRQAAQNRTLERFVNGLPPHHGVMPPEVNLIQAEDVARLKIALKDLPVDQRQVVERRIYSEETFAEIAADLKLPIGTVLTRMRLALQKLQKAFGRSSSQDSV